MSKIEMGKKYKLRGPTDCEFVRVLVVDLDCPGYQVVLVYRDPDGIEYVTTCTEDGSIIPNYGNHPLDLIEVSPYEDFKDGDPVMVRTHGDAYWEKRYFAGVSENGFPLAYDIGRTKWTCDGQKTPWNFCRRPTKEELGEEE